MGTKKQIEISSYDRARYAREDAEIDAENERLMTPCNDAQEDYDMRYGVTTKVLSGVCRYVSHAHTGRNEMMHEEQVEALAQEMMDHGEGLREGNEEDQTLYCQEVAAGFLATEAGRKLRRNAEAALNLHTARQLELTK